MTHRSRARSWLALLATSGVLVTTPAAVAAPPADPSASPAARAGTDDKVPLEQPADSVHSVTLVTGDVVTVTRLADGTETATVEPGPHSAGGVLTHVVDGDLMVIPHEALSYLAAGVVDQDLFNLSLLIDQGYADEDRATIPVIVQGEPRLRSMPRLQGASGTVDLESIGARAMEASKTDAADFWQSVTAGSDDARLTPGVTHLHLDRVVETSLTESVPLIGADQAWEAGLTGEDVTVAVLDTGADLDHPDLVDAVTESTSFVPGETVEDVNGHGTHVASTIAGSGAASAEAGGPVLKGVAPDADLVVGKVLGDDGYGMESWIIDGMEWAAERADIVNMSLGNTVPDDGTEPMAVALQQLSEDTGTLFVVASGNLGRSGGVGSPGSAEAALTVAATDKSGNRAYFSDHGPRLGPEGLVKPDLSAPGQEIVAARSQAAPGEGWYVANTGTSMATPHVAGAAAILAQEHPDWTGQQLKDALMSSTADLAGPWDGPYQVGTGIVDVPGALGADVVATGSVSFGFYDWPHEGDAPVTREVTYTNLAGEPLDLTLSLRLPEGQDAPEGMINLSADSVTVPAGGTASVEVTVDPELVPVPSTLSGWLVAHAGDAEVARTGWGVVKEDERYAVTLRATDLDGSPGTATVVYKRAGDFFTFFTTVEGEQTLRLPAGTYSFTSFMDVVPAPGETGVALLGDPVLELDRDAVVDLDARDAAEISVEVPDGSLRAEFRKMEFDVQAPVTVDGTETVLAVNNAYALPPTVDRIYAAPFDEDPDHFEYRTRWRLRTPFIEVSEGGATLDVHGIGGSALPESEQVLPAVHAGTGTQAELDAVDVDGAAVVVTRDPAQALYDVAHRVETAGGQLLVVVNDEPGDLSGGIVGPEGQGVGIPAVGMGGADGASFVPRVAAGGVELSVTGGSTSPVVYDLVDAHAGTVPADLAYAPSEEELVRIDTTYHGDREREGGEFRYDFGRFTRFGLGFRQVLDVPQERVEWVSAQEHTEWYQDTVLVEDAWNERGRRTAYEPGSRTTQDWFAAVVQPRLGDGYWLPNRQGNFLQVNLPSWSGDDPTHTGGMGAGQGTDDQVIRWYQGDTLLKEETGWQASSYDLGTATERTRLRVTSDAERDPAAWPTSVRTTTEWTFWTEAPADWFAELPFVQLDLDVETDVTGTALSPTADTIGLTAWQLPGAALAGEVTEGSLAVSYDDGATWQELALTGAAGDWTAEVVHPVGAEHASLRATAADSEGNGVSMEVIRAFLVPDAPDTEVQRVSGPDRYGTAAELAAGYAPGGVVYVASGAAHPDALSAAALAGLGEAPVLLTRPGALPEATLAELDRLDPSLVVVVGGDGAVSDAVTDQLEELTDGTVTRISGPDRYDTAAAVAGEFDAGVPVAYVASGRDFPDALAGGARAGALGGPVLLTRPDVLPDATRSALEELRPQRIVVLGGTGAVGADVADALGDLAPVERTGGVDRYATAAEISSGVAPGAGVVYLATGRDFPDALSGSAVAGAQDGPVLLTRPHQLPEATVAELVRLRPERVVLLGGTGAIEESVESEVRELLTGR